MPVNRPKVKLPVYKTMDLNYTGRAMGMGGRGRKRELEGEKVVREEREKGGLSLTRFGLYLLS